MSLVIGADPGKSGAIVLLDTSSGEFDFIKLNSPLSLIAEWISDIAGIGGARIMLEKVHAMPGQGVSSTFSFGESFGVVQMALTFLQAGPVEFISPRKWQAHFGLVFPKDSMTHTQKKNKHKDKAAELAPEGLKITHATADAFLIAQYAKETLGP